MTGTVEHIETISYLINDARIKQKNLVASMIDLRNAFGEVNHKFLTKALEFHHLPDHVIEIIKSLYAGYKISVSTDCCATNPIEIKRGVLQGDSLSPLLFNMCFNTLMVTIKREQIKCLGYIITQAKLSMHWLQFADDTIILTSLPTDNQLLLNLFSKWSNWADLVIRIDKCATLGIRKTATASIQYEPYLVINNQRVPPVEVCKSFKYLGKLFNFEMDNSLIKMELTT